MQISFGCRKQHAADNQEKNAAMYIGNIQQLTVYTQVK